MQYFIHDAGFWFRIKGYGLCVLDRTKQRQLFSARNGYKKEIMIGKYGVKLLTPNDNMKACGR